LFLREQRVPALNPILPDIDNVSGAPPTSKEDHPMTALRTAFALAIAASALVAGSAAQAGGGGKEVFIEEYKFDKPMHGYSGHSGNYYCDYQRLPTRKCTVDRSGNESCVITGWTLREMCQ
jgi:hypothetical protein